MNNMTGLISQLFIATIIPVLLSVLLFILDKNTRFGRLNPKIKQLVIGVLFGAAAVYGTEFGIDVGGALVNVRDAAPLCAGLVFGGPAGIIAGVIGGVERWFSVYWGGGEFTRLACTLGTILAGVIGAFIRKRMLEDKRPVWAYGLAAGCFVEVIHLLLVFFTHMNDVRSAFAVIEKCALPMVLMNGIAVFLSLTFISLLEGKGLKIVGSQVTLSEQFQGWLLLCVSGAFALTCVFTYFVQAGMSSGQTESLLRVNLSDAWSNVSADANRKLPTQHIGENGTVMVLDSETWELINGGNSELEALYPDGFSDVFSGSSEDVMFRHGKGDNAYCFMFEKHGDIAIAAAYPVSEAFYSLKVSMYVTIFIEVVIFGLLFTQIYFMLKKLVTGKMTHITEELSRITSGNLDVTVDVTGSSEFTSLSGDINKTVTAMKGYIAAEASRIDSDLAFAKSIQHSALPCVFPPYPEMEQYFDIYSAMFTAKEVGGDFYDFYMVDGKRLAFLIADVSGKGIPAAMFMMRAKTVIKSLVSTGAGVDEVFTRANETLCENNEAEMFVTAWLGIIYLSTGKIQFVNAGHNPPAVRRSGGDFEYFRSRAGFVLAGMEGVKYRMGEMQLQPGDEIFLYTDGVTEATDEFNELYGDDRLLKTLNSMQGTSAEKLCREVKNDVDKFVGTAPQFDDITMLSLKFKALYGAKEAES